MKSNAQKEAILYALAAVGLWSTVASAFKISLRYLSPESLLFYADLSSLTLFGWLLWRQRRLAEAWELFRQYPGWILFLGAINPFIYYLTLFHAYDQLPAQEAQAINYSWGVLLALLSVPILGQKLRRRDLLAGLLCYGGVLVIATRGDLLSLRFHNLSGVLYALASTLLWALYWLFNTRIKAEPLPLLFLNFLVGTLLLSLYLLLFKEGVEFPSLTGAFGALYVGLFEMGITFLLWLKALKLAHRTATVSNLIYLSPFLSLILIHLLVGEPIYDSTLAALVLILGGLWVQKAGGKTT
ncbi:DMT family transporter [Nitratifractor sp.]|uniref:DMT family transporter n=1 Tax=Nitratifractor sp. TaxID=2268144 RepID=UPI0025E0D53E|nr:DMT family transporter [Nitratifractor sp.]